VKLRSQRVIDEFLFILVEVFGTVFEDDVIVPSPGDFEVWHGGDSAFG
jgi:hypothetical protein